jgi:hypothetical protein
MVSSAVVPVNPVFSGVDHSLVSGDLPPSNLKIFNGITGLWDALSATIVAPTAQAPSNPRAGDLWYDSTTDQLKVWDPSVPAWVGIITTQGNATINGPITMGPGADLNVGATNQLNFGTVMVLNEGGGDVNVGPDIRFGLQGMITAESDLILVCDNNHDASGAFIIAKRANATSDPNYASLLTVQNNGRVLSNVADYTPLVTTNNTLVNKKYVDDEITAIAASVPSVATMSVTFQAPNTVAHKPGDIYVNTGTARIWIAVTTATSRPTNYTTDGSDANWKQVFPALYA